MKQYLLYIALLINIKAFCATEQMPAFYEVRALQEIESNGEKIFRILKINSELVHKSKVLSKALQWTIEYSDDKSYINLPNISANNLEFINEAFTNNELIDQVNAYDDLISLINLINYLELDIPPYTKIIYKFLILYHLETLFKHNLADYKALGNVFKDSVLPHQTCHIDAVAINNDNTLVFTGSQDGMVRTWDTQTYKIIKEFKAHERYVTAIAISQDNSFIVTGSDDKTCKIWNYKTGELINTLNGHTGMITSIAISNDNKFIVTGSLTDHTAKIWDIQSSKCLNTLKVGEFKQITYILISQDNQLITIEFHNSPEAMVYSMQTGYFIKEIPTRIDFEKIVAISQDEQLLITSHFHIGKVEIIDLKTKKFLKKLNTTLRSIAISKDKRLIVGGGGFSPWGLLQFWQLTFEKDPMEIFTDIADGKYIK